MSEISSIADYVEGPQTIVRQTLDILCGEKIGSGCYRDVFQVRHSPKFVLKIERAAGDFHNVLEWEVWREMKESKWSGYFAPCEAISGSGAALLMWRTRPIKAFPKDLTIPSFFQDVKPENFGVLRGRIVCHDYSISALLRSNLRGTKLMPAERSQSRDNEKIVKAVASALKEVA